MKLLKPTLREKNRYVAFELTSDRKSGRDDVVKAVWSTILRFLGESRASEMSLWIMDWDDATRRGILKVNHKSIEDLRCGLSMLASAGGAPASARVLSVSGTLKKARERHFKKT
jgi:ribonuclease P/MRP protein subunit POP5